MCVAYILLGMCVSFTLGLVFGGKGLAKHFRLLIGWQFGLLPLQFWGILYYNIESPIYYLTKFGKRFSEIELAVLRGSSSMKKPKRDSLASKVTYSN
jgi:hypothetical protein